MPEIIINNIFELQKFCKVLCLKGGGHYLFANDITTFQLLE